MIHRRRLGDEGAAELFLAEARTTAKFNHPHIVTIYAVGEHQGVPYVALEYLAGHNLRQRLDDERPGVRESVRIALAIADALEQAHGRGILHRDLKPANVVIPRDGRLRVVDFGLAKRFTTATPAALESEPLSEHPELSALATHEAVGSPPYMAPEQWRGEPCSGATDVWALGLIMFELLAGRRLYQVSSEVEQALAVCSAEPAPPLDEHFDGPGELSDLVAQCLMKAPDGRPTAGEVATALRRIIHRGRPELIADACPYRGLQPFAERHAELFFGRHFEVAAFVERIRDEPVLSVVGPSGAGKSSFIRAGVIPRMREHGRWITLQLRPGSAPFRTLASRIQARAQEGPSGGSTPGAHDAADRDALAELLEDKPGMLALLLRDLAAEEGTRVLLFVDQLEELFTLVDDADKRTRFLEAVCGATDDAEDPVRVILAVRDDFLSRLAGGPRTREALRSISLLQPLDAEGLKASLLKPLEAAGYRFDDPTLADEMVAAVADEANCLPMLQFAVQLMWEHRDAEGKRIDYTAYEAIGGVEGALAKHADGVLASLSPAEHRVAREIVLRLVTSEGTRRLAPRSHVLEGLGREGEQVLDVLGGSRLLAIHSPTGEPDEESSVELVHESLITSWDTLARWVGESRDELAFLSEAQHIAELWDRRGRQGEELWRGAALDEAIRMVDRRTTEVPELVHDLLEASIREHQRRQRRRRWVFGTVLASSAAITVVAVVVALLVADKEREALEARDLARQQRARTEQERAVALREGARAALGHGRVLEARVKVRMALEIEDAQAVRALWRQLSSDALLWSRELGSIVYAVAYAPDGGRVAASCLDGAVYLLDADTSTPRVLRGHTDQVPSIAISPDGRWVATGSWDAEVRLWDAETGLTKRVLRGHGGGIAAARFSPDAKLLATASLDKTVRLWDVDTGAPRHVLKGHLEGAYAVAFSPDGRQLASGSTDHTVRLWDVGSGEEQRVLRGHTGGLRAVAFSPDGQQLASGGRDHTVRLWELSSGRQVRLLRGHTAAVRDLAFSPDGSQLVSASLDRTVRLWDRASGEHQGVLTEHGAGVYGVAFSPAGDRIVSGSRDRTVRMLDPRLRHDPKAEQGHTNGIYGVAVSPDGKLVSTASYDSTVRLWNAETGAETRVLRGHTDGVWSVAFSPDGQRLASGSNDRTVRLWDVPTGAELRALLGHTDGVSAVGYSPDGDKLASASRDGTVRLWQAATGAERHVLSGHDGIVYGVSFSPDGTLLASASADRTVRLWNPGSGAELRVFEGEGQLFSARFGPAGEVMAVASNQGYEGRLELWDATTGERSALGQHPGRIYFLAFHPHGSLIGTPSSDGTARIWDRRDGSHVALTGHAGEVNAFAFGPQGRVAVTGGDDGTVRLWDPKTGRPVWRAPLLLGSPPRLLSHRGWTSLDGSQAQASSDAPWSQAVAQRARIAAASGDRVCLQTFAGVVELWSLTGDRPLVEHPTKPLADLLAFSGGFAGRSADGVMLIRETGEIEAVTVEGRPTALGVDRARLLVAAGEQLVFVDGAGEQRPGTTTGLGVTAITTVAGEGGTQQIVLGYRHGNLELHPTYAKAGTARSTISFRGVPSSPVRRLLAGPGSTLVAGYANGVVGIWDLADGARLTHARLHGPVAHLLLEGRQLHAATALGNHLTWDLSSFHRDYCELLREIWDAVPLAWQGGQAVRRPPPEDHRCVSGGGASGSPERSPRP
ncbi:MAG: protein kinase [Deltaproteobacteria bacterium]|nr:protein kinase [Deltaproteobacteria bacterium]